MLSLPQVKILLQIHPEIREVSNARDRRSAMPGVIAPLSLMIFDNVFLETPRIKANFVIVIESGIK